MSSPGVEEPGMLYNDFTATWETLPILNVWNYCQPSKTRYWWLGFAFPSRISTC